MDNDEPIRALAQRYWGGGASHSMMRKKPSSAPTPSIKTLSTLSSRSRCHPTVFVAGVLSKIACPRSMRVYVVTRGGGGN